MGPRTINFTVLIITCLLCFAALELSVRMLGHYNIIGQFIFFDYALRPYSVSGHVVKDVIEDENISRYILQDSYLGWRLEPGYINHDGMYMINMEGIRSDHEFYPNTSSPRIALYGDSMIYGAEVNFEETIGYYLQGMFNRKDVEVMNMGVSAYGLDQAYLYYLLFGMRYDPDIVIIGVHSLMCTRNEQIIPLVHGNGHVYSKPRFILYKDHLQLVNFPAVKGREYYEILDSPESSVFSEYDEGMRMHDGWIRFFWESKLLSLIYYMYENKLHGLMFDQINEESMALCKAVLTSMYNDAEKASLVYIVNLPVKGDLILKLGGRPAMQDDMLTDYMAIDPSSELIGLWHQGGPDSIFMPGHHYSATVNRLVAEKIYSRICADSNGSLC